MGEASPHNLPPLTLRREESFAYGRVGFEARSAEEMAAFVSRREAPRKRAACETNEVWFRSIADERSSRKNLIILVLLLGDIAASIKSLAATRQCYI